MSVSSDPTRATGGVTAPTPAAPPAPQLPPLPLLPEPASAIAGAAMVALPVASGAGALVMALGRPGTPLAVGSLVVLVASILVGLLLLAGQRHSSRARLHRHRRRYLGIVDEVDRQLLVSVQEPGTPPASGWMVRVGIATASRPVPQPRPNSDELAEVDPVCAAAVTDLRLRRGTAHGLPLELPWASAPLLAVVGPEAQARDLLRSLLFGVVRHVPPPQLAVVVRGDDESWARWLPHCSSALVSGRGGALHGDLVDPEVDPLPRLLAVPGLSAVLEIDLRPRRTPPSADRGDDPRVHRWFRLDRDATDDATLLRITIGADAAVTICSASGRVRGHADVLTRAQARMLARDLAGRYRQLPLPKRTTAVDELSDVAPRSGPGYLRAVVGHRPDGTPVVLDLKDAAQDGMGPHGLVIGATGAGKSELLRTLTLRLAQRHAADDLALMLVDYKGGSTFAPFAALPHVAGMLTNLADDDGLVERFADALRGESARRQMLLARAAVADITAYRRLPEPPEPLPTLLVVVDEYAELLAAHPDLADLFVQLGRIGRSLGLHLLLATQRLDPGRSRGVEGQLSYRVVLRTFTAAESQELLGSTAAFTLPHTPGEALLGQAGQDPTRFRVSPCTVAPPERPLPDLPGPLPFPVSSAMLDRLGRLHRLHDEPFTAIDPPDAANSLSAAVAAAAARWGAGTASQRPARPIWLPPLPRRLQLTDVPHRAAPGRTTAPLGLLDLPGQQRQEALTWTPVDEPNLLITGAGRTGRSTTLLTVIAATGWTAAPGSAAVYAIALGGSDLTAAAEWPHVAGVAAPDDPDHARRLLGLLVDEIERRERGGTAAGRSLVLLVVDDWAPSTALDDDVDRQIADIARRGPAVGVASAVTTAAGVTLRGRLAASFGLRIELRPADAFESTIDRRRAAALPAQLPGRALVADGYAQIALPPEPHHGGTPRGRPAGAESTTPADELGAQIARRWSGHRVPRRRPLPARVELSSLLAVRSGGPVPDPGGTSVVVGVEEADGPPIRHAFTRSDPHLLVLGDPGSGRTTALRAVARQLNAVRPAPLLVAVDLRDGLIAADDHVPGGDADPTEVGDPTRRDRVRWAATVRRIDQVAPVVDSVLRHLRTDPPPQEPTAGERTPSVPARAPVFVLVDDEELLASGGIHPLTPLLVALRSGADLGLHLIVARASGGYARARFEPLHQALADLGTPTLLLSSSAEEGALNHRLRPRRLPPGRAQWAVRSRPTRLLQLPSADDPAPADEPR